MNIQHRLKHLSASTARGRWRGWAGAGLGLAQSTTITFSHFFFPPPRLGDPLEKFALSPEDKNSKPSPRPVPFPDIAWVSDGEEKRGGGRK